MGGGIFLVFLFLHWLFLEPKEFGLPAERFFAGHGGWFFALVSIILTTIIWFAQQRDQWLAFAASVGSCVFFITHGFKEHAEQAERNLTAGHSYLSDISKLMYLEVLDATFSIDGVVGAFAFTMSVPLIIAGNGLGAVVVRELTIRGVDQIKNYAYMKNGAMYSILFLGVIMLLESLQINVPHFIPPIITFLVIGYFSIKSIKVKKTSHKVG